MKFLTEAEFRQAWRKRTKDGHSFMVNGSRLRLYVWLSGTIILIMIVIISSLLMKEDVLSKVVVVVTVIFQLLILGRYFVSPVPFSLGVMDGGLVVRFLASPLFQVFGRESVDYLRFMILDPRDVYSIVGVRSIIHYPTQVLAGRVEVKETIEMRLALGCMQDLSKTVAGIDSRRRSEEKLTMWLVWGAKPDAIGIDWERNSRPSLDEVLVRLQTVPMLSHIKIQKKEHELDLSDLATASDESLRKKIGELCAVDQEKVAALLLMSLKGMSAEESLQMARRIRSESLGTSSCEDDSVSQ